MFLTRTQNQPMPVNPLPVDNSLGLDTAGLGMLGFAARRRNAK
jgi:hypothetical protein